MMGWFRWMSSAVVVAGLLLSGIAIAGESPTERQHDSNSPSDVMMERCMGAEGHKAAGEMMDRMHGEGTHERMHRTMDQMMGMMGMMGGSMGRGGMMGPDR